MFNRYEKTGVVEGFRPYQDARSARTHENTAMGMSLRRIVDSGELKSRRCREKRQLNHIDPDNL